MQARSRLEAIETDEDCPVSTGQGTHASEQAHRLERRKVPDSRPGKVDDAAGRRRTGPGQLEGRGEVGLEREYLEVGKANTQPVGHLIQVVTGNVHGDVPSRRLQAVEQSAGLGAAARPEFHEQHSRADRCRDVAGMGGHDLGFGSRQVVLVEPGDLLEQLRAPLVVEVLARQGPRLGGQPVDHVVEHLQGGGVECARREVLLGLRSGGRRHHRSRARRKPMNCQRSLA